MNLINYLFHLIKIRVKKIKFGVIMHLMKYKNG